MLLPETAGCAVDRLAPTELALVPWHCVKIFLIQLFHFFFQDYARVQLNSTSLRSVGVAVQFDRILWSRQISMMSIFRSTGFRVIRCLLEALSPSRTRWMQCRCRHIPLLFAEF